MVHMSQPVRPFVHISCKYNSSLTDELILMKPYTVAIYNLQLTLHSCNIQPEDVQEEE